MRLAPIFAGLLAVTTSAAWAETFDAGGVARTYSAIVPNNTPAPLVLVLHGNTQQGDDMRTRTSWPDVAKREGLSLSSPMVLIAHGPICAAKVAAPGGRHRRAPTMRRS